MSMGYERCPLSNIQEGECTRRRGHAGEHRFSWGRKGKPPVPGVTPKKPVEKLTALHEMAVDFLKEELVETANQLRDDLKAELEGDTKLRKDLDRLVSNLCSLRDAYDHRKQKKLAGVVDLVLCKLAQLQQDNVKPKGKG
jgi:hypothetical protein